MKVMKDRLLKFRQEIAEGDFKGAISRLNRCYIHGMRKGSKLAEVMNTVIVFDAEVQNAVKNLEEAKQSKGGERERLVKLAMSNLDQMDHLLDSLPQQIHAVVHDLKKEEKKLKKAL
jgi:hypothetical protein